MLIKKIICWIFGHNKGEKIFEKSFYSPSLDKWQDCEHSYCKRCGLSWPTAVYHGMTIYHRTIPIWICKIRNKWIFRNFGWTEKKQREWEVFIEHQIKFSPEIYYGVKKAAQLRREVFSRMTKDERGLFTEYNSEGYRIR